MEDTDGPSARLPKRETRGKRLTKLIEDEDEADQAFWGQDAFNEEDQEEYAEEEEEQDVFDSDFDDDEDLGDDEEEDEDDRPRKRQKRPPGAAPKRPVRKASGTSKPSGPKSFEAVFQDRLAGVPEEKKVPKPKPERPKVLEDLEAAFADGAGERRSKRAVVVEKNVEREQEEKQRAKSKKVVPKKKPVVEERRLTQEEMLAEAAQTEIANLQSLEIMLAREEEIKRKAVIHKEAFAGPQIRYHSKDGHTILEFTRVDNFPEVINSKAPPCPPRSVCAVTGLPAKYKDPVTGLPYATLEAFKVLRERSNTRGKRPRPNSSEGGNLKRRAKGEAPASLLGLKRGGVLKGPRDSPPPSKKERKASPREGHSSADERSPGPPELPPSRFATISAGAAEAVPLPLSGVEQPLPSLQDVTFEDFDVGGGEVETPAEPGVS